MLITNNFFLFLHVMEGKLKYKSYIQVIKKKNRTTCERKYAVSFVCVFFIIIFYFN